MNPWKGRLGWLAALVLILGGMSQPVRAQPLATLVSIHPAAATIAAGDTLLVEVWVEEVSGLYGADIQLQFDPTAFRVTDANPDLVGVQLMLRSDLLQPGFVIHREADNQAGTIWYANSQVNPAAPANGSGALFAFGLQALKNGVFSLEISSQQLSDKSGNPIPAGSLDAAYTLQGYKVFLSWIRG